MERLAIWRGLDEWRAESTHVRIDGDRLTAHGTQLGAHPYRLDYKQTTGEGFVAERLELSVLHEDRLEGDYSADIHFDDDGLLRLYEDYLERVQPSRGLTPLA